MQTLRINGSRLWSSIMEMAKIGATPKGGSCRLALSDEDKRGRDLFASWCRDAGCEINIDRLGNMFARRAGSDEGLPPVAMGSHLDTQPHGGKFDGVYGVLAGLEVIRTLNDHRVSTQAPLELINWTNEEGSRFAPAMLASGVFGGEFELDFALSRTDVNGSTVAGELARIGYAGSEICGVHPLSAFLEVHIEQGPILEQHHEVIGVVSGGQGQRWFNLNIQGEDSHAGSTPMPGRKDALVAAAEIIQGLEAIAHRFAPDAVATVGELRVYPNSRNTIPGSVMLSLDVRNPDDAQLSAMSTAVNELVTDIARDRQVSPTLEQIWYKPPVHFADSCINAIEAAVKQLGYPWRRMISGAGHDACQVAGIVPTAMIFVPCANGLSHNEAESAEPEHLEAGANTLLHAALRLAN